MTKNKNNTLIIKFYGLHKIKYRLRNSSTHKVVYFIIMSNVFYTRKEIHTRYDLKGSLHNRTTKDTYSFFFYFLIKKIYIYIFFKLRDPSIAKKDLDFL